MPVPSYADAPRSLTEVLVRGSANGAGRDLIRLDDEVLTHDEHDARVAGFSSLEVEAARFEHGDVLRPHAASLLAPYKVPKHVWFVDEPFPRSPSGKLLKRDLKTRFTAKVG
jgi:acyl-CoA synthetase (AMP-forming)/AMP-acid ligase II